MKKNTIPVLLLVTLSLALVFVLVFSTAKNTKATEPTATPDFPTLAVQSNTPLPTSTPDPCSPANIPAEVARVHVLMREFDDASLLAQNTLLQDVVPLVQDMQRIRRSAEDLVVPSCVADLKQYELAHMNTMIELFTTALAFYNAYGPNGDQNTLDQLTAPLLDHARVSLQQYADEYAQLMGLTPVPVITPQSESPALTPTP